jgi:predicted nuclease of predicted toxin-antitoxin system
LTPRNWPSDPGDAAILAHAQNAGQVVLTLDKACGELAVVRGSRIPASCA